MIGFIGILLGMVTILTCMPPEVTVISNISQFAGAFAVLCILGLVNEIV